MSIGYFKFETKIYFLLLITKFLITESIESNIFFFLSLLQNNEKRQRHYEYSFDPLRLLFLVCIYQLNTFKHKQNVKLGCYSKGKISKNPFL